MAMKDPRHVMPEEVRNKGRKISGGSFTAYRGARERVVPPEVLQFCDEMEGVMRRMQPNTGSRIVYTLFPAWGNKYAGTWQVYYL